MNFRTPIVTLAGAAALTAILAPAAAAHAAADWRYVAEYRSVTACRSVGQSLVAQHRAREYRCENTYTESGTPVLDLYVR